MGRRRPYRRVRKAQEGRHDCDRTPEHPRCLSHRADGAHPVGARRRCAAGCALRGLCPGRERLRSRLRPDGPAALGQREHPWLRHAHHRRRQLRRQRLAPVERRSGRFLRAGRQHGPQDPATSWPSSTRCRARPSTRAFAQGQLSVQTDCEAQYGAYSQNGKSGPLRRYAQNALPKAKERLDLARRLAGRLD